MSEELIPFTKEGYDVLQSELVNLKSVERPKVIQAIAEARSHGDLKENADYSAARERQGFIEARIKDLDAQLSRANVLDFSTDPAALSSVRFGAKVALEDLESGTKKTYKIVGDLEADLKEGKISLSSPIAKALLGKKLHDVVEVQAPKGNIEYSILGISY